MRLTLDRAQTVVTAAMARGVELGLKPLAIAVLDEGGHLLAFAHADGASTLRPQIAMGKAAGALALGVSSRRIEAMAAERPTFVASLGPIAPHGVVPAAGGVIIVDDEGRAIGAVGVTGDLSDNDELCALAGATAAGLPVQA